MKDPIMDFDNETIELFREEGLGHLKHGNLALRPPMLTGAQTFRKIIRRHPQPKRERRANETGDPLSIFKAIRDFSKAHAGSRH